MTYYLYHIPGKKIGVTRNLEERVHKQQGYKEGEYVILAESKDISEISTLEIQMQKAFGYKVDRQLYSLAVGIISRANTIGLIFRK